MNYNNNSFKSAALLKYIGRDDSVKVENSMPIGYEITWGRKNQELD